MKCSIFATFLLLCWSYNASAAGEVLVVISYDEPALESVAKRVQAELRSAGREEVLLVRRTPLGACSSREATGSESSQVGVLLRSETESAMVAEICVSPQANQVTTVTARGERNEEGDFAIVVTEALHGMFIAPAESVQKREEAREAGEKQSEELDQEKSLARSSVVSLSLEARTVVDIPTGGVWLGMVPGMHIPLGERWGFGAEVFVGFYPIKYADAEIELESHLVWARFGLIGSGYGGPFLLGWHVSAGPFSNRVNAEAVAPRKGGSDGTFGAIIHAGGSAEFPTRGLFFARSSLGVSTLLPRLNYQMSEEVTPEVGTLLLEGGLALGVRLGE